MSLPININQLLNGKAVEWENVQEEETHNRNTLRWIYIKRRFNVKNT